MMTTLSKVATELARLLVIAVMFVTVLSGTLAIASPGHNTELPTASANIRPTGGSDPGLTIRNRDLEIVIDRDLRFRISTTSHIGRAGRVSLSNDGYISLVKLESSNRNVRFHVLPKTIVRHSGHSSYGRGEAVSFDALSEDGYLVEKLRFIIPDRLANVIVCEASLINRGNRALEIGSYNLVNSLLDAVKFGADSSYKFWSFQGGSYPERPDWIFPLTKEYERENFQGMNAPDYGGGIPVIDFWTKEIGLALAVIDRKPELVSLPVKVQDGVQISIADSNRFTILPGDSAKMVRYAIILHTGDFFNGLRTFSTLMRNEGLRFPIAPSDAFEPEWCAWGYERNFNKDQILKTLPEVKKLGFGWVTIDDGWQNNLGDWEPSPAKFPGGGPDFEAFIDSIHSYGLKVRLWWCPFAAQDSSYSAAHFPDRMTEPGMSVQSKLALEHPDWFILDRNGNRIQVSWWNAYLICPALHAVRSYYESFVRNAIVKWKVDGFKIDGQNSNMVPECFNASHHHAIPAASCDSVSEFFKCVYDEATGLNPYFLVQLCPCGTNFSVYNLPFVNQTVASDPLDSWQVRLKGKTFRALYGSRTETYSGDHAELTNRTWNEKLQKFIAGGYPDFASTLAVGGIPASKFTITGVAQSDSSLSLDSSMLNYYKKWMNIYSTERMSEGTYLNLYDIAFDKPETHVIRKGDTYYYSFFSNSRFEGKVELRGLAKGRYKAIDLWTDKPISEVDSSFPWLRLDFKSYMLVKVEREKR